jgi:hypothetical protein
MVKTRENMVYYSDFLAHAGKCNMVSLFASFWQVLITTLPGQLFLFSGVVLVIGLGLKVWDRAVQWSFVNTMALADIEKRHPHLPSSKIIAIIFLCNIQLLVLSMYTVSGSLFLREANYYWLYLAVIFIISTVLWIFAEMRGQRSAEYGLAFNVGTTVAFFFLLLQLSLMQSGGVELWLLLSLFVCCIILMWFVLSRILLRAPRIVLIATFAFWLLLSQLQ